MDSWLQRKYSSRAVSINTYNLIKIREENNMGSNLGLIGIGLVALFATSMLKFVAIAAIAWGAYKAWQDWGAM
jgi:hypothetical protein|tara:strand:- start:151 stop:369 length:219 start_codon:yes stop_codon:yes gene_type:complete